MLPEEPEAVAVTVVMSAALTVTVTALNVGTVFPGQPLTRPRAEEPVKATVTCPYEPSLEIEGAQEKNRAAAMIPIARSVLFIMKGSSLKTQKPY
jgi:hypothetical protein